MAYIGDTNNYALPAASVIQEGGDSKQGQFSSQPQAQYPQYNANPAMMQPGSIQQNPQQGQYNNQPTGYGYSNAYENNGNYNNPVGQFQQPQAYPVQQPQAYPVQQSQAYSVQQPQAYSVQQSQAYPLQQSQAYPVQQQQQAYPMQQPTFGSPPDSGRNKSTYIIGGIVCCVVILVGLALIILGAVGVFSGNGSCKFTLNQEIRNSTTDHIGIIFSECPSDASFVAFTEAANTWNAVLSGTNVGTFSLGSTTSVQALCGSDFLSTSFDFGSGATLDHLVIFVEPIDIDGVNGVLAQAAPCSAFVPDPLLPLVGGMQFDNADLAALETEGILQAVVTHEMAHVLGFGTVWGYVAQGGVLTEDFSEVLLQDPIFTFFSDGSFSVDESAEPTFKGSQATAEFNVLQGSPSSSNNVPVEDGRNSSGFQTFDIVNGDGQGSIDSHWKITTFGNELMTFAIDPADAQHPLSAMTIQSLSDLGYTVNANLADAYSLPGSSTRSKSLGKDKKADKILRGYNGDGSKVHYLHGDVKKRFNVNEIVPLSKINP